MVFQKPTPFPMSIYDNIAFGVQLNERLRKREMEGKRVEWALKSWHSGQRRRTSFARAAWRLSGGRATAAVHRPELPSNRKCSCSTNRPRTRPNLDRKSIEELISELKAEF